MTSKNLQIMLSEIPGKVLENCTKNSNFLPGIPSRGDGRRAVTEAWDDNSKVNGDGCSC